MEEKQEAIRRAVSNMVDPEDFFGEFQCDSCKHYKSRNSCSAFEHIPMDIIVNRFIHAKKYPGQDNDVVYEAE
jgi:uncharacterized UBP type Zn finger protein